MKYEYDVTFIEGLPTNPRIFNKMGEDGWEMCGVAQNEFTTYYYWKRRLPEQFVEPHHDPVKTPGAFLKPEDFMPPKTNASKGWREQVLDEHMGIENSGLEHA